MLGIFSLSDAASEAIGRDTTVSGYEVSGVGKVSPSTAGLAQALISCLPEIAQRSPALSGELKEAASVLLLAAVPAAHPRGGV
ncbi:MAG: hypothetical protein L0H75_09780 [Nitrosospira sp.]|nr:hypothetical protein [Nitrosospira sp.]